MDEAEDEEDVGSSPFCSVSLMSSSDEELSEADSDSGLSPMKKSAASSLAAQAAGKVNFLKA